MLNTGTVCSVDGYNGKLQKDFECSKGKEAFIEFEPFLLTSL
jgi:hypothetical protein